MNSPNTRIQAVKLFGFAPKTSYPMCNPLSNLSKSSQQICFALFAMLLCSVQLSAQCNDDTDINLPANIIEVDLTASPDAVGNVVIATNFGPCCNSQNNNRTCVRLEVSLNFQSGGINFTFNGPNQCSTDLWEVDGPGDLCPPSGGQSICDAVCSEPGDTFIELLICKPGAFNNIDIDINSVPRFIIIPDTVHATVTNVCREVITATDGFEPITWTSIDGKDPGLLNLDCGSGPGVAITCDTLDVEYHASFPPVTSCAGDTFFYEAAVTLGASNPCQMGIARDTLTLIFFPESNVVVANCCDPTGTTDTIKASLAGVTMDCPLALWEWSNGFMETARSSQIIVPADGMMYSVTVTSPPNACTDATASTMAVCCTAPVVNCPMDTIVNCDVFDPGNVATTGGNATFTDGCGIVTVTFSDDTTSNVCPDGFVVQRTFVATDENGSSSSCMQMITVQDTTPPTFTAPAAVTINCEDDPSDLMVTGDISMFMDNCSPAPMDTVIADVEDLSGCSMTGTITRTFTVSDSCGNIATAEQTITISMDMTAPVISCPADTAITCGENTESGVLGSATATDNCSAVIDISFSDERSTTSCAVAGIITRTWVATDDCGNSSSCAQVITIIDTIAPSFVNCPVDTLIIASDPDLCGANVNWSTPTSLDDCCLDTVIEMTALNGTELAIGFHTVIYIATDASGNTSSCEFVVEILDTQGPLLTCPSAVIRAADSMCVWVSPMDHLSPLNDFDNCPVDVTYYLISEAGDTLATGADDASGQTFELGSTQVCYVATENTDPDMNGMLSDTCCFWVIVEDVMAPNIDCPADTIIYTSAEMCATTFEYNDSTIAIDNCDDTLSLGTMAISGMQSFTNNVSMDPASISNSVACPGGGYQTMTVLDLPALGVTTDLAISDVEFGIRELFGTVSLTMNIYSIAAAPVGDFLYTDLTLIASGSSSFIGPLNNVIESIPVAGTIAAGTVVVLEVIEPNGQLVAGFVPGYNTAGVTAGDIWLASDFCGVPDPTLVFNVVGITDHFMAQLNATAMTETGGLVLTAGLASGSSFPVGVTTSTFTATDSSGNVSTCSFTVTVLDTIPPVIECLADTNLVTSDGGLDDCAAIMEWAHPIVQEACGFEDYLVRFINPDGTEDGPESVVGSFNFEDSTTTRSFEVGVTTVEYYVEDPSGNTARCSFTVTVTDDESPVFVICPDTLTVGVDPFLCEILPIWSTPIATDNCELDTIIQTAGPAPGTELSPGNYDVEYTATDVAGNTSLCAFVIEIIQIDTVDASTMDFASCEGINQQTDLTQAWTATTSAGGRFEWVGGSAPGTGGTGGSGAIVSGDVLVPDASGTYVIYYIVGDTASDISCADSSMFTVTIDGTLPMITGVANDTIVSCGDSIPAIVDPVITDNCPIDIDFFETLDTLNCANNFVLTRTWIVIDQSGNSASASQMIIVSDESAPVPSPAMFAVEMASCGDSIPAVPTVTWTDNCSDEVNVDFSEILVSLASSDELELTRTWIGTDLCGNSDTVTQTVIIQDGTLPTIECPADIGPLSTSDLSCDTLVTWTHPTPEDGCGIDAYTVSYTNPDGSVEGGFELLPSLISGNLDALRNFIVGTTTVSYIVVDQSGNTAGCSFTVTIVDDVSPVFVNCPDTITVGVDPFLCEILPIWSTPVAEDNCRMDTVMQTAGPASGTELSPGFYEVTYLATDTTGNTSECVFTIEIVQIDEVDASTADFKSCEGVNHQTDLTQAWTATTSAGGRFEWLGGAAPGTGGTGSATSTISGDIFVPQDSGYYVIMYIVGDTASAISCSDTSVFTVLIDAPPVITCPDDIVVENDLGMCGAFVEYDTIGYFDICPDSSLLDGFAMPARRFTNNADPDSVLSAWGCSEMSTHYSYIDMTNESSSIPFDSVSLGIDNIDEIDTSTFVVNVYTAAAAPGCDLSQSTLTLIASDSIKTLGLVGRDMSVLNIPVSGIIPAGL